jgi:hypothetical protein
MGEMLRISLLYPEIPNSKIVNKPSRNKFGMLYRDGFKYCSREHFMIKVSEKFCRICGKPFRTTTRKKSKKIPVLFSYSIKKGEE